MQRALVIAGILAGCDRPQPIVERIVDLDTSLAPIRDDFDAHVGERRFLALLSPT